MARCDFSVVEYPPLTPKYEIMADLPNGKLCVASYHMWRLYPTRITTRWNIAGSFRVRLFIDFGCPPVLGERSGCFITVRNSSCGKVMFSQACHSFHGQGVHPLARHPPQPDRPPWANTPGQTPPPRRPLQRTVRILLECILVTRMHSSRMRTGRSLTICQSLLPVGGLLGRGVVSQHALRQTPPPS